MKGKRSPENLLREAGCGSNVIAHCKAVRDLALIYARNAGADIELVETGAMLHDIGRAQTHSLAHAQVGADYCRKLGFPERLARIVECHIGAGLTAGECREAGLKPINCIPQTTEEKIVAHADNLVKGTLVITIEERLKLAENLSEGARGRMRRLAAEMEVFRE